MALHDVVHNDDGSITITIREMKKTITASDGSQHTLVSYDGISWRLQAHSAKELLRLKRGANLKGKRWEKAKKKNIAALQNPGRVGDPLEHPYTIAQRIGSPILGKGVGKKQKFRRNLRIKKEREVQIAKPVHYHACRGENHPKMYDAFLREKTTRFICGCATPKKSRFCGPTFCLYD